MGERVGSRYDYCRRHDILDVERFGMLSLMAYGLEWFDIISQIERWIWMEFD